MTKQGRQEWSEVLVSLGSSDLDKVDKTPRSDEGGTSSTETGARAARDPDTLIGLPNGLNDVLGEILAAELTKLGRGVGRKGGASGSRLCRKRRSSPRPSYMP